MSVTIDENKIKSLMKDAIIELIEEQHDVIYSILWKSLKSWH